MKYMYYIASRFFPSEEDCITLTLSIFNEIVTTDHHLCKLRYFDSVSNEYMGIMDDYHALIVFDIHHNEQLIKFVEVKEPVFFESDIDFEFCGFDIMNSYGDESFLTSSGIPYDINRYKYTPYGLLDSFESSIQWVYEHSNTHIHLKNSEFLVFAVWRQV